MGASDAGASVGGGTAGVFGSGGGSSAPRPARHAAIVSAPIPQTDAAIHTSTPMPGINATARRIPHPAKNAPIRLFGSFTRMRPKQYAPAT